MKIVKQPEVCAHCGRPIEAVAMPGEMTSRYCSFRCEVLALLAGLGPGLRWLLVTLIWGLIVLALLSLIFRAVARGVGENPLAYVGLALVLVATLALLTPWFRGLR